MNGVKVALGNIEMTVEAARQCAKDKDTIKISPRAYPWQNRVPSMGQGDTIDESPVLSMALRQDRPLYTLEILSGADNDPCSTSETQ